MRGSVVRRTDSKGRARYYVVVDETADGKRRRRWHSDPATGSAFTTRRAADEYCASLVVATGQGTYVTPSHLTTGQWLTRWLDAATDRLRPSTWASYEKNLRVHVLPTLADVPLQQLTTHHLDELYARLRREGRATTRGKGEGLSPRTVRYVHTIVRAALKDAARKGLVVRNVADQATPPAARQPGGGMATWTAPELARFVAGTTDHPLHPVLVLLAMTGMRRGEALGLRWSDVDLDRGRVYVSRTVGKVAGRVVEGDTKTAAGRRSVALDPQLVELLDQHFQHQAAERDLVGVGYVDRGLVFASPTGDYLYPEGVSRLFKDLSRELGLPVIRLHDLRHTWATLALQAGVHPKVVQERLGHSTVTVTLQTYSHVLPAMHDEAAATVANLVRAAADPTVTPLRAVAGRRSGSARAAQ
jgi:integrase